MAEVIEKEKTTTGEPMQMAPETSENLPAVAAPQPKKRQQKKAKVGTGSKVQPLIAADMESMFRMAMAFAKSRMLPKSYYDEETFPEPMPRDRADYFEQNAIRWGLIIDLAAAKAFTAMQLGAEVGLPPMTSIQSIAVVNGCTTIWGDTQKALVLRSGKAEFIREWYEGDSPFIHGANDKKEPNYDFRAWVSTKRFDSDEIVTESYSVQDVKDAGLWDKRGSWQTHKPRMMRYKIRAFVLRDTYPDVLKGLTHSSEEMEGEEAIVNTPARARRDDNIDAFRARQQEVLDDAAGVTVQATADQAEDGAPVISDDDFETNEA